MNIEQLYSDVEDMDLPTGTPVKILIDGVKYDVDFAYREDYSDGRLQLVLVQIPHPITENTYSNHLVIPDS